jgi:protein-disulfide isomerase
VIDGEREKALKTRRVARSGLAVLLLGVLLAVPATAQQATTDDLKKEIDSLRTMLQAIQKDLQELKGMMARQAPPPSGIGAVIDYGNSPTKGERTAKLTLVEFSDYQ